jgi:NitT/TauT family transport system ATP-binding protein
MSVIEASNEKAPARLIVELVGVGKTFVADSGTATCALGNVTLSIRSGEFITVLGPTGCGKSTLLDLVAGIGQEDAGTLRGAPGIRLGENIAYVFQHYTLFPWRKVLSNVAFGLQVQGVPRRRRKEMASELLAKVGLAGFEDAYPHELSGGMRQRVAIAQALATKPQLLLMDEPFGALDDATRTELQHLLATLWRENGVTVVFVTHNIDEAIVLGSRIVILGHRPGTIVREFSVDLPCPRDSRTDAFADLFMRVRSALSETLD